MGDGLPAVCKGSCVRASRNPLPTLLTKNCPLCLKPPAVGPGLLSPTRPTRNGSGYVAALSPSTPEMRMGV